MTHGDCKAAGYGGAFWAEEASGIRGAHAEEIAASVLTRGKGSPRRPSRAGYEVGLGRFENKRGQLGWDGIF